MRRIFQRWCGSLGWSVFGGCEESFMGTDGRTGGAFYGRVGISILTMGGGSSLLDVGPRNVSRWRR